MRVDGWKHRVGGFHKEIFLGGYHKPKELFGWVIYQLTYKNDHVCRDFKLLGIVGLLCGVITRVSWFWVLVIMIFCTVNMIILLEV